MAGNRGKGRPKGTPNKLTASVKEAIESAAQGLGGGTRLEAWAREAPENEKAFWTTIYPKLLPLQVTGRDGGPLQIAAANLMTDEQLGAVVAAG